MAERNPSIMSTRLANEVKGRLNSETFTTEASDGLCGEDISQ